MSLHATVAVGVLVAIVAARGAGDASASTPRGLEIVGPVATLASDPLLPGPSAVRTDRAGNVFVVAGRRIAAFSSVGTLIRDWSIPPADTPTAPLVFDALPDGTSYAAALGGDTVYRFDAAGHPLGSWTGAIDRVLTLTADPRGSIVIADRGSLEHATGPVPPRRFAPDGRYLGRSRGPAGTTAIAGSGSRWLIEATTVRGVTVSGRPFQQLSRDCPIGHTPPGWVCPSGIGGFGAAPPRDIAAAADGRLAVAELSGTRVQFFDRSGRVLFACRDILGAAPVTALTYDTSSDDVLLAAGWSVYRARFTTRRQPGCERSPLRVTDVRAARMGRAWRISYRLSRPARVQLAFTHVKRVRCGTGPADRFDPERGCVETLAGWITKGPGRRGLNRAHTRLPAGRWYVQIKAVDEHTNSADTPLKRLAASTCASRAPCSACRRARSRSCA